MTTITTELGTFEDCAVVATKMALTNAGDGLSESLTTDPQVLHVGDQVCMVIRGRVSKVRFVPASNDEDVDDLVRDHVVKASSVALVDEELVAEALESQEKRNAARRLAEDEAREKAKGVQKLEGVTDQVDAAQLDANHRAGEHGPGREGMVEGCPSCDDELAAEAAEAQS